MARVSASPESAPAASPSVCAIVVTFNRREMLEQALQHLDAQTRRADTVLVVDNASSDGTAAFLAQREGIEVLRLADNVGGAGGFEQGLRHAHATGYDWYWLLDDDTFAEPTALDAGLPGVRRLPAPPSIITSAVRWKDGTLHPMNAPYPRWSRSADLVAGVAAGMVPIRRATFVSTMIARSAVEAHGFPHGDYFIWHDDTEYTARVLNEASGFIVPDSVAWHWTGRLYDVV